MFVLEMTFQVGWLKAVTDFCLTPLMRLTYRAIQLTRIINFAMKQVRKL
jgi:hypothetical protein